MKKFIDHMCCAHEIFRIENIQTQIAEVKRVKPLSSGRGA